MDSYTFLLLFGIIVIGIALEYFRDLKYWNRIDKLLNRLQAPDYKEFRYYEDQYKPELKRYGKQMDRIQEQELKEQEEEPFTQNKGGVKLTPEVLEEDWTEEELGEAKAES